MKWTEQNTQELRQLCIQGVSNKELAKHFGCPRTEIYAKRSSLGITIPKVAADAAAPASKTAAPGPRRFVKELGRLLHSADERIAGCALSEDGDTVLVSYASGSGTTVNVAGDSLLAVVHDVTLKCLF